MDWNTVEGNWKEMKGEIKKQWNKLTDDEISQIEGKREKLVGAIQKEYGKSKEEAENAVDNWTE